MANHLLHPSVRERLDPKYIEFHEKHLNNIPPPPEQWNPSIRGQESPISLADLSAVPIGSTKDYKIANGLLITVLWSEAKQWETALPTLLWFHGGMFELNHTVEERSTDTVPSTQAGSLSVTDSAS
jgi:hypothetical protein